MPCSYKIFAKHNLVSKAFTGRITTRCVLQMLDEIESDPLYREGMTEFDDLRGVTDLDITATDIAHFAELVAGMNTRKRRPMKKAILAVNGPSRAAAHGFCQMVEGNEHLQVAVFETELDAFRFLEFKEDQRLHNAFVLNLKVH